MLASAVMCELSCTVCTHSAKQTQQTDVQVSNKVFRPACNMQISKRLTKHHAYHYKAAQGYGCMVRQNHQMTSRTNIVQTLWQDSRNMMLHLHLHKQRHAWQGTLMSYRSVSGRSTCVDRGRIMVVGLFRLLPAAPLELSCWLASLGVPGRDCTCP